MPDDATIIEGDAGFLGMASRLNPVQLPPGMCQLVENMRLDRGVAQTRKGARRLADNLATDRVPLSIPFTLGTTQSIAAGDMVFSGGSVTVTLPAHGFATGQIINISGASPAAYNGDFVVTATDADTFTYTIAGTPTSPATGSPIAQTGPVLQSSYAGGIFASWVFSNPSLTDANEYIALASTDRVYLWRQGAAVIEKTYPTSADELIEDGDEVSMLQAFNRLYLLRKASVFGAPETIASITRSGTTATVSLPAHGFFDGQKVRISGAEPSDFNGLFPIVFIDANSFSYTCPSTISALVATGTMIAEGQTAFGPQSLTAGGITVSTTTATVNCTGHGYSAGQTVRLEGSIVPEFDGIEYQIASAAANSFTVTVPAGTAIDTAFVGRTVRRVKPALYWDGDPSTNFVRASQGIPAEGVSYRRMQSVGWAAYIANRLWLPDGRDTVTISDVLDPDLYDPFFQNFRANQGSNDYLVGIHPWVDGQALVFMRNSIWLATLAEGYDSTDNIFTVDAAVSRLTLVTNEVGCIARRSIQTAGNFVFFLSDSGIYRLDTKLDLKVRGDTLPLSEPIADQLADLNSSSASRAVGAWFNNRYYLAVATGGSTYNNTLFVYNALNEQWESRDRYESSMQMDDLLISDFQGTRRLFASSLTGKLFVLEEWAEGDDTVTPVEGNPRLPVQAILRTRRFAFGSPSNKRLLRATVDAVLPSGGSFTLRAVLTNPDMAFDIATLTNEEAETEDYSVKAPIRARAHYAEMELLGTVNMPSFRGISIEATRPNFSPTTTRTTP